MLFAAENMESYHRGAQRNPNQLYELLQVDPTIASCYSPGSIVALLNDVLTSGSHFTAARRRILKSFPEAEIIGIFWARSVSPTDELEDV